MGSLLPVQLRDRYLKMFVEKVETVGFNLRNSEVLKLLFDQLIHLQALWLSEVFP